jgi:peptide/nickel transport system substrate-binding protein
VRWKVSAGLKMGLVSGVGVLVLFGALFGVVLNVPVAGVGGTIYIRADGSVEPSTTPISNLDNVTYTFTDNINDPLVIERDNIVVDGDGHATQGIGTGTGIELSHRSNVTLKNLVITQFDFGIHLNHSASCAIVGNIMMENNFEAIRLYESLNNNITSNGITATDYDGIVLYGSSDNKIYENNLTDNYDGIRLYESSKNDIAENIVTNNYYGIFLAFSSNNSIFYNNISTNDGNGVSLAWSSSENRIVENHIAANKWCGIYLNASSNNTIYHNSFVDNAQQISVNDSANIWNEGYPSAGNYWSDYTGEDFYSGSYQNETGSDGIDDASHIIDVNNMDHYPLMGVFHDFEVIAEQGEVCHVQVVSNSTVHDLAVCRWLSSPNQYLQPGQKLIWFFVVGVESTGGFCRITIPRAVLNGTYTVLVDWTEVTANELPTSNSTQAYLYFTYNHTEHEVIIVTEFPSVPETSIIIGTTDSAESNLDPARAYGYFGWNIIQNMGCGLVDFRPGSTASIEDVIPALATDWSVSSDGLVWTFNLRQGVQYDDGTEFNATHVKYTFDRGISLTIPDGPFVGLGIIDMIKNVTVVDGYTVRFCLNYQFAPFLVILASPPCYIVNPKYAPMSSTVGYVEGDARASNPMDLGPYKLTNWTKVGGLDREMVLEANPNYWNATGGYPKTEKIIIKFYSDSASLRSAIEFEEIDIAFRQLSMEDVDALKHDAALKVWEGTGAFIQYLAFQTKPEMYPLNITEVRRAIAAAINRTILTETVFLGQMEPLYSTIPNGMAGHVDAFKVLGDANYTYTRSLLAELGYNESNKLTFDLWYESSGHYPMSAEQALLYKEALEASGVISVTLKSASWASYRQNRNDEIMDVYIYGWSPDYVDPDDYTYPLFHSTGGAWLHNNYANPEMDTLIENARTTTNATERSQIYAQIQLLTAEDCPIVPLFQAKTYTVTKSSVEGISLDISQLLRYWLLYTTNQPRTWIVDDDGPADFHTIQEAIDNANEGDTVFVRDGTYYGHVTVSKTLSVRGSGSESTTISGRARHSAVEIGANNVDFGGFTVCGGDFGLKVYSSNNNIHDNDIVENGFIGIYLYLSSGNTFTSNSIARNGYGVSLVHSGGNTFKHNSIFDNEWQELVVEGNTASNFVEDMDTSNSVDGKPIYYWVSQQDKIVPSDAGYVALVDCRRILVQNLTFARNGQGVLLAGTTDSMIENNTLSAEYYGIYMVDSSNVTIRNCTIANCNFAMEIWSSNGNKIMGNNIVSNAYGIELAWSNYNNVSRNTIQQTSEYNGWGVCLSVSATGNRIYENDFAHNSQGMNIQLFYPGENKICHNNFIQNAIQVCNYGSVMNTWDDCYPSGGNYWSDYTGIDVYWGHSQDLPGTDGIGDAPCAIDENNRDCYPLMAPYSTFDAGNWNGTPYNVDVVSNSTVSGFHFNPQDGSFLEFNVTGQEGTAGFCRVTIPKNLLWAEDGQWVVLVGGVPITNYTTASDQNYAYLYFTYGHSTKTVQITGTKVIPELPSTTITPLLMILAMLATAFATRKIRKEARKLRVKPL